MRRALFALIVLAVCTMAAPAFAVCGPCDYETGLCFHDPEAGLVCWRNGPGGPCFDQPGTCGVGHSDATLASEYAVASVEVKRPEGTIASRNHEQAVVASLEEMK